MGQLSSKLRKWATADGQAEGLNYWCQGCNCAHSVRIKGPGDCWSWNGDAEKPVFSPSVLATRSHASPAPGVDAVCHTFVGCNGAQPGEVIFLSDCTHALAGTVQPFPDLPEHMRDGGT